MIGETISHYRIAEKLGEGGMGIVYRATDLKLDRSVALKLLSAHLASDADARSRFLREAKAAAALDHSNICMVHEIDEVDDQALLAMQLIEGPTVKEKIAERPLKLDEALEIAIQTASGLQAAHEKGVVHRDIKSANLMMTVDGQVKIMDFGLARLADHTQITKTAAILGTPAYMSPEQAQGQPVDHRSDIFSFGVVLYEMVTGRLPFLGDNDQSVLYAIINQEPEPPTALRTGLPTDLDRIVLKTLTKDPTERYQHVDDMLADLRVIQKQNGERKAPTDRSNAPTASQAVSTGKMPQPGRVATGARYLPWGIAAFLGLALLGVLWIHFALPSSEPIERSVRRFSFDIAGLEPGAAISPDGKHIVYRAQADGRAGLLLRSLEEDSVRELQGTGEVTHGIFWSPDSAAIGFATLNELKRVAVEGGSPITICTLPTSGGFNYFVGTWSPDGESIVFGNNNGLYEVSAGSGEPELILAADEAGGAPAEPHFLPYGSGSRVLVYERFNPPAYREMVLLDLETGERREMGVGYFAAWSPSGHLVHGRRNSGLWALPFSLTTLQPIGEPFRIAEDGTHPSVSRDGTLVYVNRLTRVKTLVWRDRAGEIIEEVGQPQVDIREFSLSPDGRSVAVTSSEGGTVADVWVHDLTRSASNRLTFGATAEYLPTWSPSGREIAHVRWDGADISVVRRPRDGASEAVTLVRPNSEGTPTSPDWSRDGRYLVYHMGGMTGAGTADILYVELETGGGVSEPKTFLSTPASELAPRLSPDGRLLTYVSDDSGRPEVYVRSFPDAAGPWQVSFNGGTQPRWGKDGKHLFYVEQATLKSVPVSTQQGFALGQPSVLFGSADLVSRLPWPQYDVSADGQRFLTSTPYLGEGVQPGEIRIVQNWYEEFRDGR